MSEEYLGLVANDDNSGAAIQTLKLDNGGGTLTVTNGTPLPFTVPRKDMGIAKATFGDITYVVCAGGRLSPEVSDDEEPTAQIDVFKVQDGVVTPLSNSITLSAPRSGMGAVDRVDSGGHRIIFVGGLAASGSPVTSIEAFTITSDGTLSAAPSPGYLLDACSDVAVADIEFPESNVLICAGGITGDGPSNRITTYAGGAYRTYTLSVARSNIGIATVEIEGTHYVVCVGGKSGKNTVDAIDVFSVSSTGELILIADQANLANTLDGVSVIPVQEKGTQYILCIGGEKDRVLGRDGVILFAGGNIGIALRAEVAAYLVSGDTAERALTQPDGLDPARQNLAAAGIGNIILFAGGNMGGTTCSDAVDAYLVSEDGNSVERLGTLDGLSPGRYGLAGAAAGTIILFAGGYASGSVYSAAVDAYLVSEDGNSVERLGTLDGLSPGRYNLAAASAGNIILFAGGNTSSSVYSAAVDAYKVYNNGNSVAKITVAITGLSPGRSSLAGASAGNIILFAGGYIESTVYSDAVDAYLVSGDTVERALMQPDPLIQARSDLAGAAAGNIILFAGGESSLETYSDAVDAYLVSNGGNSVARMNIDLEGLSLPRSDLAGAAAGNIVLFAGGLGSSFSGVVQTCGIAIENIVNFAISSSLSPGRDRLVAAAAGNIILFAGGYNGSVSPYYSDKVDAYLVSEDGNSVARTTAPGELQPGRSSLAGASAGNIILFAGGYTSGYTSGSVVSDAVDAYLVSEDGNSVARTDSHGLLSVPREGLAGAAAGNIILFAGGFIESYVYSAAVDAYLVSNGGNFVKKLTVDPPDPLGVPRGGLAGAAAGNIILFAGGYNGSGYSAAVDAYLVSDGSSVARMNDSPGVLQPARAYLAAAAAGNIILFAGGNTSSSGYSDVVDAYLVSNGGNSVEKIATPGPLSVGRRSLSAASFVGDDGMGYIVFSGGQSFEGSYSTAVDVYKVNRTTDEVTKVNNDDVPQLLVGFYDGAGAGVNGVALFGGGSIYPFSNLVDAYRVEDNDTVTKLPTMTLSQGCYLLVAAGATPATIREFTDRIEVFKMHANGALTAVTDEHTLLEEKGHVGSTMVSMGARDYLVCAGGVTKTGPSDKVEVFEVDIRVT